MATISNSIPHEQRTAYEPRENRLEPVVLSHIREINDSIRLLRLSPSDPNRAIRFLPGQWLDVFLPGIKQAGGFTITSTPFQSRPSPHVRSYLELAVQRSKNPPAQWLWQPQQDILDTNLVVRVGGSFHWPPPNLNVDRIDRLVLVAGGVGINPLISIFSYLIHIPTHQRPREIHFVYATKATPEVDPQKILFLPRLLDLVGAAADPLNVTLSLYVTGTDYDDGDMIEDGNLPNRTFARRFQEYDLTRALDGLRQGNATDRSGTLCYVCGPSRFTDETVAILSKQEGMNSERVLCEKWW